MNRKNSIEIFSSCRFLICRQVVVFLFIALSSLQLIAPYISGNLNQNFIQLIEIECEQETKSVEKNADIDKLLLSDFVKHTTGEYAPEIFFQYSVSIPSVTLEHTTPPPEQV